MTSQTETNNPDAEYLFATFFLNELEFAIDVNFVQDAIPSPPQIIALPSTPEYLTGIIDLRDNIVPIIDTRKRFKMAANPKANGGDHIAITRCQDRYMGLTFDAISEVVRVKNRFMEPLAPEFQNEGDLLAGIIKLDDGKRLIQIINPNYLFDYKELPVQLQRITQPEESRASLSSRRQTVAFQVGGQAFGIDVRFVREIIKTPEINQKILVEEYILGAISLREELISIIDLRRFLTGVVNEPTLDDSRIIILKIEDFSFGILVDAILEVITFTKEDLQEMPGWSGNRHEGGFSGVLERPNYSLVLLAAETLFAQALKRIAEHVNLHDENYSATNGRETRELEEQKKEAPPVTFITFALDEVYGVEITNIREIVRYQDNIRQLPGQVDYIEGILNLRSEVIPVINLRRYFNKPTGNDHETMIMIFTFAEKQIGILIDHLLEIRTLSLQKQDDVPHLLAQEQTSYSRGLVERIIEIENREGEHTPTMILDISRFYQKMDGRSSDSEEVEPETETQDLTI
ncbi:MAG: chemotaxis protein CheW [Pseudomonadota bacterium]|nr:chemotaxis protein CheW [Pseudomonadota bacterium]